MSPSEMPAAKPAFPDDADTTPTEPLIQAASPLLDHKAGYIAGRQAESKIRDVKEYRMISRMISRINGLLEQIEDQSEQLEKAKKSLRRNDKALRRGARKRRRLLREKAALEVVTSWADEAHLRQLVRSFLYAPDSERHADLLAAMRKLVPE